MSEPRIDDEYMEKVTQLVQIRLMKVKTRQGLRPMPLDQVRALQGDVRQLFDAADAIHWLLPNILADGGSVRNPELAAQLAGQELGLYSLSVESINYLERVVDELAPSVILECGSGTSTLALQTFLAPLRRQGRDIHVISVDQSAHFLEETRRSLARHGLDEGLTLLHAEVAPRRVGDVVLDCYDLSGLETALQGRRPELALIDGPCGRPGSRLTVLPEIARFLADGAVFLLDDALRDGEQWAARVWEQDPRIHMDGIVWVGKGFLRGSVLHAKAEAPAL